MRDQTLWEEQHDMHNHLHTPKDTDASVQTKKCAAAVLRFQRLEEHSIYVYILF